ncbi:MAG: hypothetical protein IIY70_02000 [Oscillospiraceae bacterium]|nr:hypothetical protein [Oscillospiraceae bacterium]
MDYVTHISVLAAIAGIIFGLASFFRNKKKDDSDEGKQTGTIMSELGYIKAGVDDMKRKQEKTDDTIIGFMKELTAVQESTKQAHKRLDVLEDRVNNS